MKNLSLIVLCLLTGCVTGQKLLPSSATVRRSMPPPEALAATGGFTLSPTGATAATSGGSGTVALTATWTAFSSDPTWLSVTPTSGSGNTTLTWSAAPNTGPARAASLTIAGQTFTVSQAGSVVTDVALASGVPVNDSLSATTSQSTWKYYYIDVPAGSSGLTVEAFNMTGDVDLYVKLQAKPTLSLWDCRPYIGGTSERCQFSSPAAGRWWIGIVNYATGTISYTVKATIATATVCTYSISPTSSSWSSDGGIGGVTVTTTAGCAWNAVSSAPWLTCSSTGSGTGTATYLVASNTTSVARSATLTIGGQILMVTQAGVMADTTPPSVPTGVIATAISTNQINLSWNPSTDTGGSGIFGYKIYLGGVLVAAVGSTNFSDTDLIPNTQYCFSVAAYDNANNLSAQSAIACATTQAITPPSTNTWAKSFGGTATDYGAAVVVDGAGNIVVTGIFSGSVNFGGIPLTSAGGYDVFLAKYTPAGAHVWSKRFGGTGSEVVKGIALDSSGNIFICGNLITGSLAKFSAQGDPLWTVGPVAADFVRIATDSQGNAVVTGDFAAPFATPMNFGGGLTLYSQYGAIDAVLAKYSPSGICLWVKGFANSGDSEYGVGVAVDKTDNILVSGYATGRINLGGMDLTNNAYGNVFSFLGKFLPTGAHVWSRRYGVCNPADFIGSSWCRAQTMTVDGNGDAAVAGAFAFHTNLGGEIGDSGNVVISGTSALYDVFVAKYSGASGAYQWSKPITGNQYAIPGAIAADAANNVIVTGNFYGTYTFGSQTLTAAGTAPKSNSDGFVTKLSSVGNFTWAKQFGGALDADGGKGVAVDSAGNPVVTGAFQGVANVGGTSLTSAGGQDVVLWKLNP